MDLDVGPSACLPSSVLPRRAARRKAGSATAIADIGFLDGRAALFVLAMAAGMAVLSALPAIRAVMPANAALEDG